MKIIFFIICYVITYSCLSQNVDIDGFVKDKNTNKNLPFVSITYISNNVGTYSDESGYFKLKKIESDSLIQISSIGYQSLILNVNKIPSSIFLVPTSENLDEIVINKSNKKFNKTVKLGLKEVSKVQTALPFGYEFSAYIINDYNKEGKVTEVILSLNKEKNFDYISPYSIKFYAYDTITKQPGELLYHENIIVKPENKTYKLKIDVEKFNIPLPKNGICVGVELVNTENHKLKSMYIVAPRINFTLTRDIKLTWSRFMNKNWKLDTRKSPMTKNSYNNAKINIVAKI